MASTTPLPAEQVDAIDLAAKFYHVTDVGELVEGGNAVTFRKTGSGDAFMRWSLNSPAAMPLTDENERVEIDFAGFCEGGSVQVLLYVDDAQGSHGKPRSIELEKNRSQPGRLVVESVSELAKTKGVVEPAGYHLFFRIKNDPTGAVTFDRIGVLPRVAAGKTPGAEPTNAGPAGTDEAEVIFRSTPVEHGMRFDRGGAERTTVKRGGGEEEAWVVEQHHGQGEEWQRSFHFDITDPAFVKGGRGSIDIEVTYMLNAWGGVHVLVDTADGPGEIADLWGDCNGMWKSETVRVDNALLNDGIEGGYDLTLAGDNGPLMLKRVRVTGYHSSEAVRWERMLQVVSEKPVNSAAAPLFIYHRQEAVGLAYKIRNHAAIAPPMRYQIRVFDDAERAVHQEEGTVLAAAGADTPLELTFNTSGWALGPYTAEVNLYLESGGDDRPVYAFRTLLGVVSDLELAKGRPGEFEFGLDPGAEPTSPEGLAFYRVMGVDMLRSGFNDSGKGSIEDFRNAYDTLAAEGVSAAMMMDPPGQMEDISNEERLARLDELLPRLERLAAAMRGTVTYFELGNEPDLPFFYPGTIEQYNNCFAQMSDAIKRGNPDAIVMNGGLCFFGEVGDRRARRFIEIVDMDKLDAWAYHGHGQGGEAERDAYQRQVQAVAEHGKATVPYLDTETGMAADSPVQYREQSRTGVQKMVFAHAQGMPSLMWFRLFMGDDGYTLSHHRVEPRPTVLS